MIRTMRTALAVLSLVLACLMPVQHSFAQSSSAFVVAPCVTATGPGSSHDGVPYCSPVTASNPLPVSATVTASISGFTALTVGTPISVTTASSPGTLPGGTVVVATNVGANGAFCELGATGTTAAQFLSPGGGWFAFTVGSSTQLSCITSSGSTTVNLVGGSGIPTGAAAGSGTNALPIGAATAANQEVTAAGSSASSAQAVQGVSGGVPFSAKPGQLTPLASSCQLTVSTTAVETSTCSGGIPAGSTYALICNEATAARWRDDGTPPTTTVGQVLGTGTSTAPICAGFTTTFSTLQWIAESGSAILDISFYK
jgi:hypothetical protein